MEADHPHLTTQKSFYVEISRARDRAGLVTDDAARLRERLEGATGERISALEAVAQDVRDEAARAAERAQGPAEAAAAGRERRPAAERQEPGRKPVDPGENVSPSKEGQPAEPARWKRIEIDLDLEL